MGYNYHDSYSSINYDDAAVGAVLGGFVAVFYIIFLAIAVIQIIAMWKIFSKAGEKGWKAIIPIYNMVILFKISGLSPWLILVYLASIIPFVGWIAPIALNAVFAYKLAKSFGKDGAWAVGIYFLAPIFYMILAFGKSEYIGPNSQNVIENNY